LVDVALSKDAVLTVTNSSESFIPIQRIINDKVKLTFNDYPEEAGLRNLQPKKNVKTLVLTTTELKVTSVQSMKTHFLNTK
jgi:adenosylcobinamide amidohydrolase